MRYAFLAALAGLFLAVAANAAVALTVDGDAAIAAVMMACCRFRGHEDKIVTKELESRT
jgi:hypothetical protein